MSRVDLYPAVGCGRCDAVRCRGIWTFLLVNEDFRILTGTNPARRPESAGADRLVTSLTQGSEGGSRSCCRRAVASLFLEVGGANFQRWPGHMESLATNSEVKSSHGTCLLPAERRRYQYLGLPPWPSRSVRSHDPGDPGGLLRCRELARRSIPQYV